MTQSSSYARDKNHAAFKWTEMQLPDQDTLSITLVD